jgi:hypothetical protein
MGGQNKKSLYTAPRKLQVFFFFHHTENRSENIYFLLFFPLPLSSQENILG